MEAIWTSRFKISVLLVAGLIWFLTTFISAHAFPENHFALITAASRDDAPKAKNVVRESAESYQLKHGNSPLMVASLQGNDAVVKVLLGKGANVHHRDIDGRTALMEAPFKGFEKEMKVFREMGYELKGKEKKQWEAVRKMMRKKHEVIVRALLKNGANVNAKSSKGETALGVAKTKTIAQLLRVAGAK